MSAQTYRGNGAHSWEPVTQGRATPRVERLRVPGGWLYSVDYGCGFAPVPVLVPMPEAVKHAV